MAEPPQNTEAKKTTAKADADDYETGSYPAKKRGRPVKQGVSEPEELSIDFEEDGQLVRRGVKKEILSKGAWVTVMYLFQDLNRKKGEFGPPKVSIARYKKSNKVYQFQKEFTLSSAAQVKQVVEVLQKWLADGSLAGSEEGEGEGS